MSGRGEPRCPVVGIVGGGLAGTLTAVNLLRGTERPVEVVLLERSGDFGPGVAYSTHSEKHLLNQPAERMSAFGDAPGHFRSWAERHVGHCDPGAFLPRRLYGAYLRSLLDEAVRRSAPGTRLHRVHGEVVELAPRGGRAVLRLADGREITCDRAVLARGPLPAPRPTVLPIDPRVFGDPWAMGALSPPPPGATVLLIGTGLTAVDAALSMCGPARVVAVSRRGMLPFAHLPGLRAPAPAPDPLPGPSDVETLESTMRAHAARMATAGYDWRDVVDGIRPAVPELWRSLAAGERRRFLQTHARAWEVRRHRMAPAVAERVRELRSSGRLEILRGSVSSARAGGAGIDVTLGDRTITADRVVVCAGAGEDITRVRDPLLRALIAGGHAVPDPLALGFRTSPSGAVLDRHGRPSPVLFTLGALRRGELWESTAVAEIRAQAATLCRSLFASARFARQSEPGERARYEPGVAAGRS